MSERLEVLLIENNPEIPKSSVGDFCEKVEPEERKLLVAGDVYRSLQAAGIKRAELFVVYAIDLPTKLANSLQWSLDDVRTATHKLVRNLKSYVPDKILHHEPQKTMEENEFEVLPPE